ncbi:MAG: PilX N-terminal domain-containing pilus assembly protein [bacterium]
MHNSWKALWKVACRKQRQRGAILVTCLLFISLLTMMGITAMLTSSTNIAISRNYNNNRAAFYAAESGIEQAMDRIIGVFEDLGIYGNSTDDPNANALGVFVMSDFNGYEVTYAIENTLDRFLYTTHIGTSSTFHWAYSYKCTSEARFLAGKTRGEIVEHIRILETPLVQYYIFYGGSGNEADLEWLPGPNMNSWGRVHANGDVYLWCNNTLTFRNYTNSSEYTPHSLTASGSIFRRRKDSTSSMGGTVKIRINNQHTIPGIAEDYKELPAEGITVDNWASMREEFNGFLTIGVNAYSGTTKKSIQRGEFYELEAANPRRTTIEGIQIIKDDSGVVQVFCSRPTYQEVTAALMTDQPTAVIPSDSLEKNDQREGKPVNFITIDINLLQDWYVNTYLADQGLSLAGDGILIYASQTPTSGYSAGSTVQAIKLAKSASPRLLDETTFVTDNPVYIEGDFNTLNKRGCCIISDAMSILSNAWSSAQASAPGSYNNASQTSINAAFITGNVPTPAGGGDYSGGLENFPRFLENWSGVQCIINGCFINLWSSQQATGKWEDAQYSPPIRSWGWDTAFEDYNFWPPLVPSIFSVQRVAWKGF